MHEGERWPANTVGAFKSGARVGGNKVSTRKGFFTVGLLWKGDVVVNLVDSSLTGKTVGRPPLLRGNAESS